MTDEGRVERDAFPRPAVYKVTATMAPDDEKKAKLCVEHAQLAHDYKPPKPDAQVIDQKRKDFNDRATAKNKTLGDDLCRPERVSYQAPRMRTGEMYERSLERRLEGPGGDLGL